MKDDVLQRYKKIQTKFNLPQINELKETFKCDSENVENIDQLRMEISDQLFAFTEKVIEHIIVGNDSFCCLFEQDMLDQTEREKLFSLYKKIQVLKWENNLLMLKPNDKKTGEWISSVWSLWNNELEQEVTKICKKLSSSWSDLRFKEDKIRYMG